MIEDGKAQETAVVAPAPRIRRLNIIGRRNLFRRNAMKATSVSASKYVGRMSR